MSFNKKIISLVAILTQEGSLLRSLLGRDYSLVHENAALSSSFVGMTGLGYLNGILYKEI